MQAPDGSTAARYTGLLLQYRGVPLADVYRARTELEVDAVGLLAAAPAGRIDTLAELVERGEELLDDPAAFAKYDTEVHRAVMELAGNQTMAALAGMLLDIMDAHNALYLSTRADSAERPGASAALRANRKLVTLLRGDDAEAAQAFWRRHLDSVERYMTGDSATTLVEVLS